MSTSPWPSMRGNQQNTGVSPLIGLDPARLERGDAPVRHWRTGNGVFSTPVIGADETIYVGSADSIFYAFDPESGEERWRFRTGECIDSAACIDEEGSLYMASCDACLYALDPAGKERWRLDMLRDREYFSPSTSYWWEANVVLGPNGLLYAPSDDFYLYAVERSGKVRWAGLTGLLIWTAPAFGADGSVYVVSFDTCCYAFDADTGEVRWRQPTGNFVASSPAVGADGAIHFGSFDNNVYALDGASGAIRWQVPTGGPIYGTAAIAPDGMLYIGSSDGLMYAISTAEPSVRWTFYTGDAIRASAALGPDPEGRAAYLIYFGGGDGQVYALDPEGRRRWSYDTLCRAPSTEYPNINASMALGRQGLATASANGDIIWIPYDAYQREEEAAHFDREPSDGYPASGAHWYYISPGGTPGAAPVTADADALEVDPAQVITLRPVVCEAGRGRVGRVDAGSVAVELDPPLAHRIVVQPDRSQLNVVPLEVAEAGRSYRATYVATDGAVEVRAEQRLRMQPAAEQPGPDALCARPFSITHMAIHSPPIVPSFDQIGIASLTIDVRLVTVDPERGRVVGWGVKKFGVTASGEAVGVPIPRHHFFAFGGRYRAGHLILEAEKSTFELTGFPVPVDYLRFSGAYDASGAPAAGTSMLAEYRLPGADDLLRPAALADTPTPAELPFALERGLRAAGRGLAGLASVVGSWFPEEHLLASLPQMARAARLTLPLAWDLLVRGMHRPWGLFSADGHFSGVGTFRAAPWPKERLRALEAGAALERLNYDPRRRQVSAVVRPTPSLESTAVLGILVFDEQEQRPLVLDYNRMTRSVREPDAWSVSLDLPLSTAIRGRQLRAALLLDTCVLGQLGLVP